MPDISIVIPTYNEVSNIEKLVEDIDELDLNVEVIIVDDNSPDGTGALVEQLKDRYKNLQVIHRTSERGLASAVVRGFDDTTGEIIGVMDADFSHPTKVIPALLKSLTEGRAELAVGSRYVEGGGIVGWNLLRKTTSKGAIFLARPLTPIKDSVSGFFFFKKGVIEGVELNPKGYKIGLEVIVKGRYKNVIEFSYVFVNRKSGKSKLNYMEYLSYLSHLSTLYLYKLRELIKI